MKDLGATQKLELDWDASKAASTLQSLANFVLERANETIDWYIGAKNTKRLFARGIRVLAILLAATAALLPTIGELLASGGRSVVGAGWTVVLLGAAGALLLLDRFFGFSTSWMRYIAAELQLRQFEQEFQMDWEAERARWHGNAPDNSQVLQMVGRCKAFVTQVNTVVREETAAWMKEFESALRQIDEASKLKAASDETGALNLTVTNGDAAAEGWTLSIDGAPAGRFSGMTAGKRGLVAGRHEIRLEGVINGRRAEAVRVCSIPVAATREEVVTLS